MVKVAFTKPGGSRDKSVERDATDSVGDVIQKFIPDISITTGVTLKIKDKGDVTVRAGAGLNAQPEAPEIIQKYDTATSSKSIGTYVNRTMRIFNGDIAIGRIDIW
jgi:hypothetical protein